MKQKGKVYADRKRRATDKEIETGDVVLVRNFKPKNKLSSPFEDALYEVKSKDGKEVTVESEDGVEYRRNSAHVKRYVTEGSAEGTTPEKNAIGNKTSGEENQNKLIADLEESVVHQNDLMSIYYKSNN